MVVIQLVVASIAFVRLAPLAWVERRPSKKAPQGRTWRVVDIDRTGREQLIGASGA